MRTLIRGIMTAAAVSAVCLAMLIAVGLTGARPASADPAPTPDSAAASTSDSPASSPADGTTDSADTATSGQPANPSVPGSGSSAGSPDAPAGSDAHAAPAPSTGADSSPAPESETAPESESETAPAPAPAPDHAPADATPAPAPAPDELSRDRVSAPWGRIGSNRIGSNRIGSNRAASDARKLIGMAGCTPGKFAALTRNGSVYSYSSEPSRSSGSASGAPLSGAAANFTQTGTRDRNFWFSFADKVSTNDVGYEALGVGADGVAYAVVPGPDYSPSSYQIVKRNADGSLTSFGNFELNHRDAIIQSGALPEWRNYTTRADRIRGGAVNPTDGMYYFVAYVRKAQHIPSLNMVQLQSVGAYVYRLNEQSRRVEFVGWYTLSQRADLDTTLRETGDIEFNQQGDMYFLFQKGDIGTVEDKLDVATAKELQRAAKVRISDPLDSFRAKELAVSGGYFYTNNSFAFSRYEGGWDLIGENSERPGSNWTGRFGIDGSSGTITRRSQGFRLDGLANVGEGHVYVGGVYDGNGTGNSHRNVVSDFVPGGGRYGHWNIGNSRMHDVSDYWQEVSDLASCGKPDLIPIDLTVSKKLVVRAPGVPNSANAADPGTSVTPASRWDDSHQFRLQAGVINPSGQFADDKLAQATTTGKGDQLGNNTTTRTGLRFGDTVAVGERLIVGGRDVTVDPYNQIPDYQPNYYCSVDGLANANAFRPYVNSGIMKMRLPQASDFRADYLASLRRDKRHIVVNCTIANVPIGSPITLTKTLDGDRVHSGGDPAAGDQFALTIRRGETVASVQTRGTGRLLQQGTDSVTLPLAQAGKVYMVDELPAGATVARQVAARAPDARQPGGAPVAGTRTELREYRSVISCVMQIPGERPVNLAVSEYAFAEGQGVAVRRGVQLPADKRGAVACTVANTPLVIAWNKVDSQKPRTLLAGSAWTIGKVGDPAFARVVSDCVSGDCAGQEDQDPAPGRFRVTGLTDGEYTLSETTAPQYYRKLAAPLRFTVKNGALDRRDAWNIGNTPLSVTIPLNFPLTGGHGSTVFLTVGTGIVTASLIMGLGLRARRRSQR